MVAVIGVLIASAAIGSDATAQVSTEDDGVGNLAACYQRGGKLAVEFVVDQSGSLKRNDPGGSRVDLARSVVQVLGALSSVPVNGATGRIDVRVVGFGSAVQEVIGWQTLDPTSTDRVSSDLEKFRDRNGDPHTDYVDALFNARADVLRRAGEIDPAAPDSVCRAVFWFTDGQFDFEPTGEQRWWAPGLPLDSDARVAKVIGLGNQELCRAGGVADTYRDAGSPVYLLTVALLSASFTESEAGFLDRVTTNAKGDCGARPGAAVGRVLKGDDLSRLLPEVFDIFDPKPEPRSGEPQNDGSQTASFLVDPSTRSALVFVEERHDAAVGQGRVDLVAPNGETLDLTPPSVNGTVSGVPVTSRQSGPYRTVTLDFSAAPPGGLETWSVHAIPPAGAGSFRIWVVRRTGIGVQWAPGEPWVRGEPGSTTFQLVDGDGRPITGSTIADASGVAASVQHGDVSAPNGTGDATTTWDPTVGTFTVQYTPSLDQPAASARVALTGDVVTTAGDRVPIQKVTDVAVRVPDAPIVTGTVDLGVIEAKRSEERDESNRQLILPVDPVRRTAIVEGDVGGDGRVCLADGSDVSVGTSAIRVSSVPRTSPACIEVPAKAQRELPLEFSLEQPVDGTIRGFVSMRTISELTGRESDLRVPVRGSVVVAPGDPIVDEPTRYALILGSVAAAILLWLVLSWRTSFFSDDVVLVRCYQVSGAKLSPLDADFQAPEYKIDGGDFEFLEARGRRRAIVTVDGDAGQIELTAPVRLFRPQDAKARCSGFVVHGPLGGRKDYGLIAHQVQGQWLFLALPGGLDQESGVITGDLCFFVLEGAALEFEPEGVFARAITEVAREYETIRGRLEAAAPSLEEQPDEQQEVFL